MEGLNKIISLVLGLIVVVVIVAIIAGRLNLSKRFASITKGGLAAALSPIPSTTPASPSLSPAQNATATPTTATKQFPTTAYPTGTTKGGQPTNIPKTGSSEGILLLAVVGIGTGFMVKRMSA